MLLAAAVPVFQGHEVVGVLVAGELLNRRNAFVDEIKSDVFLGQVFSAAQPWHGDGILGGVAHRHQRAERRRHPRDRHPNE